jgi:AraC-like DNA-binding protein
MNGWEETIRGAAIGGAMLLGIACWRTRSHQTFAWVGFLLASCAIAYLVAGQLPAEEWLKPSGLVVAAFAMATPFVFWLFSRLLFEDEFRLRRWHFLILALIELQCGVIFVARLDDNVRLAEMLGLTFHLSAFALVAHAFWLVWQGRSVDLVAERVQLRGSVVLVVGIATASLLIASMVSYPLESRPSIVRFIDASALLLVVLALGSQLLSLRDGLAPVQRPTRTAAPITATSETKPRASAAVPVDDAAPLLTRLAALMEEQRLWRHTGLTIGALAEHVGIPEYRLRELINRRLGFRNFTAYLNEYRLAAAATRLADPAEASLPILSIALDLGWGSVGPFNRAFRGRFKMPPSEYRRTHAVKSAGSRTCDGAGLDPGC